MNKRETPQKVTENNDDNNVSDYRDNIEKFIEEFENLAEKYDIQSYIASVVIDKPILLWKPKDVNAATRMAKMMHRQLYNQVQMEIGEISPPQQ